MRSFRFVVCLTVLFTCAVTMAQTPTTPPDRVVVTVNGDPVFAAEAQMAAQQLAQNMARSGRQVDPNQVSAVAVQQLVDGMLLVQEAKRLEFKVDPAVVKAGVEQAEASAGGAEELDASLAQQGLDRVRLEELIEDSGLVNQLLEKLGAGIEISDEQVLAFYTENPTFFQVPEEVSARHILFKVEDGAGDETKAGARAKAEAARKRALEGEDFAALATELSEGPSGPKGGDLGFFTRERMVPPFSEAAFALKPGEISEIVETRFGYHVILVEERREARTAPIEEVRDRVRQGLTQEAQGKRVEELLTGLRESAEIVPAGAETVPADAESIPADAEAVPADAETVPADAEVVPADAEVVPADAETVPADAEVVPADAEVVPADAEKTQPPG